MLFDRVQFTLSTCVEHPEALAVYELTDMKPTLSMGMSPYYVPSNTTSRSVCVCVFIASVVSF